jgi:Na+-driven multidrug efflux pump
MEDNNKRILKNTVYLYMRQFVIMALSFFTTRIVLEKLGASDYGVNNVVGGFVSMFTVLNSILQTGTRRFLSLNLGKGDALVLKDTFSTAFVIHLIVGTFVVVLLETFGIWFLNSQLNIDSGRMVAANWVFQFSVLTVFLSITQTPYTAAVTSHENFSIYAFMSIFETVAKVAVLFLLIFIPGDKLIIYSALLLGVSAINISVYRIYCIRKFPECQFTLKVNHNLLKEMVRFSGWSVIANVFQVGNTQGVSILLNIFFSTLVNAARGLATTVTFTISQFVNGFIIAAEPQLVKYYGANDREHFEKLVFNITQYTLFLLAIFAVPVFMEIDYVLKLWLTEVPQYTSEFIKITIISSLLVNSYIMIDKAIIASGHIKQMALIGNTIPVIQLPLVYIFLKLGYSPVVTYIITLVPQFLGMFANLWISKHYINFPSGRFFFQIMVKNSLFIIIACIIPYIVREMMPDGLLRFLVVCSLSVFCTIGIMYSFAMNAETKQMVRQKVIGKIFKRFR